MHSRTKAKGASDLHKLKQTGALRVEERKPESLVDSDPIAVDRGRTDEVSANRQIMPQRVSRPRCILAS